MNDTLQPFIGEKAFTKNNPEVIFTASAKPPKEQSHLNNGMIQTIDSMVEGVHAFDTISPTKVAEITRQIEKIQNRPDSTNKTEVKKVLSSLKKEMDDLELIEVTEALATIDSPWGGLAEELANSDRLKQALPDIKKREQYVDKLLFPLGAEVFREIRLMTNDTLTRQLMFQSIADDITSNPDLIHAAQLSLPNATDTGIVKNPMRRVSIGLLGVRLNGHESDAQIESIYKKSIHIAVLHSRLSAEQPIFDVTRMEQALEAAKRDSDNAKMPFAKERAAQTLRESQTELDDINRIRQIIENELPKVYDESSLMNALDKVQSARFEGTTEEIAPYKFEPWVPQSVQTDARSALEMLTKPKEDVYAKVLKKLDATERMMRSRSNESQSRTGQPTWGEKKYKDHMKWLADPVARADRTKRIIDIIDLITTLTTLVHGVSGNLQHQIEGGAPNGLTIKDFIDYVETQHPWDVAADLVTPKPPKIVTEM